MTDRSPANEGVGHPPIAYLVTRFPKTTETFIYRELEELARRGRGIRLYALHRETGGIVQLEAKAVDDHTAYASTGLALARDLAYWLRRRPQALLGAAITVAWGNRRSPSFLAKGLVATAQATSIARQVESDAPGVVHAHFATHGAVAALVIYRLTGTPWSTTVHAHELYGNTTMLSDKLHLADLVITISHFNQRELEERFGVRDTTLVRYGLDLDRFAYRPPNPVEGRWELISIGRLSRLKGHQYLIAACSELVRRGHRLRCRIVGAGPEHAALAAQIEKAGLQDVVTLLGARSLDEVQGMLSEAHCHVLACDVEPDGTRDGLPNSLIESVASGVPTISTDVAGVGELIRDGETGKLVPSRDQRSLADAIEELCTDAALREGVSRRGRELVEAEFNIARTAAELENHFDRLLRRPA